jgi:hypothetical protein
VIRIWVVGPTETSLLKFPPAAIAVVTMFVHTPLNNFWTVTKVLATKGETLPDKVTLLPAGTFPAGFAVKVIRTG